MNKFTIDLSTLDVPKDIKWITQDEDGCVEFWKSAKPEPTERWWSGRGYIIDAVEGPANPDHWQEAITPWPLPEEDLPPIGSRWVGDCDSELEVIGHYKGMIICAEVEADELGLYESHNLLPIRTPEERKPTRR